MLESVWAVVHLASLDLATATDRRPHKSNWQNLTKRGEMGWETKGEDFPRKWLANMSSEDHRRKNICTKNTADYSLAQERGKLNLAAGEGREGQWDRGEQAGLGHPRTLLQGHDSVLGGEQPLATL